jgi:putative transport protein
VTDRAALGSTIAELKLDDRFGVAVIRIARADIEMSAVPTLGLPFGDTVQMVGSDDNLDKAAATLGDSLKELNETHFIPLFLGLFLGVVVGTKPIGVPGLPQPVRLGLAAGPLIVALVLGRIGHAGRLVWHMPANASLAFREFGIALFFAAVGAARRWGVFRYCPQRYRRAMAAGRRLRDHNAALSLPSWRALSAA